MSVSSAWRYSELASSTPARKAPSAIETPASSMSSAVAMTTSSAKAVNTSRRWVRAMARSTGCTTIRPTAITAMVADASFRRPTQGEPLAAALSSESSGTMPMSGIAARSWNSRTPKAARPIGALSTPRSLMVCTAMAVDDSARVKPAMHAAAGGSPTSSAAPLSSRPQPTTCTAPPAKTLLRRPQRRSTSSSRPMTNSMSTTPNSANSKIAWTSRISASPNGPMTQPASR